MSGGPLHAAIAASDAWARLLLVWSWQSLLLLCLTWLIVKLDRGRSPSLRHQLWLAGLLAVIILPFWATFIHSLPARQPRAGPPDYFRPSPMTVLLPPEVATLNLVDRLPAGQEKMAPPAWTRWSLIFIAWAGGLIFSLARLGVAARGVYRLRKGAQRVPAAELGHDGKTLPPRRMPEIGYCADVSGPLLVGVLRPLILLPADIVTWTTASERRAIIQHELAHLERRDHWVNAFQSLLNAVFFFHPMVRHASRQLSLERELACDRLVTGSGCDTAAYAEAIIKVAENCVSRRAGRQLAFNSSARVIERRLDVIINRHQRPHRSGSSRRLILAGTVLALCVMAWLLVQGQPTAVTAQERRLDPPGRNYTPDEKAPSTVDPSAGGRFADRSPGPRPGTKDPRPLVAAPESEASRATPQPLMARTDMKPQGDGDVPRIVDPGFETFAPARTPVSGWYSDDVTYSGDPRFAALTLTPDAGDKVEGEYSLRINQLKPRPQGRGQASLSQVVRLPAHADAGRRFDLSARMRGLLPGPVTIDIYVWGPDNVARVIARRDAAVTSTWSAVSVGFDVPAGHDEFGIFFYLPRGEGAQLWVDDVHLSAGANN